MLKIFFRIFTIIFILIILFIVFLSTAGIETDKFNNIIKNNINNVNSNIDVEIKDVKIILNPIKFTLDIKTVGPIISYYSKKIELELIKSNIPLVNVFKKDISSSNLHISTKSLSINDVLSFVSLFKNFESLILLNQKIKYGFLIADIDLNFDEKGNLKNNFEIKGILKDGKIDLISNNKINKVNSNFIIKDKNFNFSDLSFQFNKVAFKSPRISFEKNKDDLKILGKLENEKINLGEENLEKLNKIFKNLNLNRINGSSKNEFEIILDKKFKIKDYQVKSSVIINELSIENNLNLNYFFPKAQKDLVLKENDLNIFLNTKKLEIEGEGDIFLQENSDKIKYSIAKNDKTYSFNKLLEIENNPLEIDFINFIKKDQSKSELNILGTFNESKGLNFEKINFKNEDNKIELKQLILDKNLKINHLEEANFEFIDKLNIKNKFSIKKSKKDYLVFGKKFNAFYLIDDLIFSEKSSHNIFNKDLKIKIDLDKVFLDVGESLKNFSGDLKISKNEIKEAKISTDFLDNKKINFTVVEKNGQKVTTFFTEKAKPFVRKFNFIKGFDEGSLDFYSVKSGGSSNSQIKIYDFKLKELPALTKLLTLASLQGMADLLSGEGIRFNEFEMKFQSKGNLITIDEIYAIGPAISILMEGYIEKNELISLRGTLVPATTINKVIGSIPLLGEILVGKKTGEGIFGVSFKIKGPPNNTETTVNPIKTLTPRFITRTLEKINNN